MRYADCSQAVLNDYIRRSGAGVAFFVGINVLFLRENRAMLTPDGVAHFQANKPRGEIGWWDMQYDPTSPFRHVMWWRAGTHDWRAVQDRNAQAFAEFVPGVVGGDHQRGVWFQNRADAAAFLTRFPLGPVP